MKPIRDYTIRGTVLVGEVKRIQLFDGAFDTGFKIKKFVIAPKDVNDSEKVQCKLTTEDHEHQTSWFWGRTSEIGWATWNTPTNSRAGQFSLVDHDAIVVQDLYIDGTGDTGEIINYYIEMEKVKVSEWQGALAMVKNSNQSV
jgi:hypothetical protein